MAVEVKTIVTAEDRASAVYSKSAKNFQATTDKLFTMNGVMAQGLTALTKLAGGFGAVEVACKAFNAVVMEGSKTCSDFVQNGLGGVKDTLGMVATAIATFDWSAFNEGVGTTIGNLVKLKAELADLADMTEAVNYFGAMYNQTIQDALETIKDPKSTAQQVTDAVNEGTAAITNQRKEVEALAEANRRAAVHSLETKAAVKGATPEMIDEFEKIYLNPEKRQINLDNAKIISGTMPQISQFTHLKGSGRAKGFVTDYDAYNKALDDWKKSRTNVEAQLMKTFLQMTADERKNVLDPLKTAREQLAQQSQTERSFDRATTSAGKRVSTSSASMTTTKAAAPVTSSLEMKDFAPKPLQQDQTESMNSLLARQKDLQASLGNVTNYIDYKEITDELAEVQRMIDAQPLALKLGIDTSSAADIQGQFDSLAASLQGSMAQSLSDLTGSLDDAAGSSKKVSKEGKENKDSWKLAAQSVSQLGSALQGVDNKGVNIAGIIMEAVANVALGFATALASPANGAGGVFTWIAAAVSGLATMTATIVSIKKATSGSYAEGGIVPGTYNGGVDNTYVYASPGEVILNRAQQQNLLAQLDNNNGNQGGGRTIVRGEQIVTALNNYGRRKGYGEVAWQ
ncbi:MAG: hypothetical protein LUI09_05680 [Prevotellaceae bacterium]|nr:hypothetical protein [Prevotellaceae bacterium]